MRVRPLNMCAPPPAPSRPLKNPARSAFIILLTSFERGLLYTFRSSNKQLNHRFLHFVVSLQSKFYTLAPTFVFDVNIYFSSSRLLTIDPSLSLLQAIHRQYLILALSLPLRWHSATLVLSTLISLKESLYRPVI